MPEWKGQSKGKVLGYKIFVLTIKGLGLTFAYGLLRFVAFYYYIFATEATRPIHNYFHNIWKQSARKARKSVYKSYYTFGKILIDKIAILSGKKHWFSYDFDGENYLNDMVAAGKGGIIINAHIGNFEIAGQLLERLDTRINILMVDAEHQAIKQYLDSVMTNKPIGIIPIKEDLSHIIEIENALRNNELIAMNGDRFVDTKSTKWFPFLGKEARFPTGPFMLAAHFQVPVTYAFAMKERKRHYHFYATPPVQVPRVRPKQAQEKAIMATMQGYITELENKVKTFPYQWFNYFEFWQDRQENDAK